MDRIPGPRRWDSRKPEPEGSHESQESSGRDSGPPPHESHGEVRHQALASAPRPPGDLRSVGGIRVDDAAGRWERGSPMSIRVMVADDHPVVRQGLKFMLAREGFAVVAEAADGREALRQSEQIRPEVAVLDLAMPGLNGIDAAREIMRVSPETKTIILSQHT